MWIVLSTRPRAVRALASRSEGAPPASRFSCDTQIKDLPIFPHDKPTHQTSHSVKIILHDSTLSDDPMYTPVIFTGFYQVVAHRSYSTRQKYSSADQASPHLSLRHECGQEIQEDQENAACYPNA